MNLPLRFKATISYLLSIPISANLADHADQITGTLCISIKPQTDVFATTEDAGGNLHLNLPN